MVDNELYKQVIIKCLVKFYTHYYKKVLCIFSIQNIDRRKQRLNYSGYDELEDMDIDKPSIVLGKYDEEIEGLKKKSFKLGMFSNVYYKIYQLIKNKFKILKLRIVIRILFNTLIFNELNNCLVFTYPIMKFDNFLV